MSFSHAEHLLDGLNEAQRKAVTTTEGPLLIVAGAGSGKTRALTHRVAYLLQHKKITPWNILAVTFTNKAAREMKERIIRMVGQAAEDIWICTFHAMCVRILRRDIERLGYSRNFTILDTDDQLTVVKQVLKEENLDPKKFEPRALLAAISQAKNKLISPEAFKQNARELFEQVVAQVYEVYQDKLRANQSLDFDDLIMVTIDLFRQVPDVLQFYQKKFQYIHVDEYQDTNYAQYELIHLLADYYKNICCVGDDDQSIYMWRGADISNILNFERDYPEAAVVKLERNYRSTATILDAANGVIAYNSQRKEKKLWTDKGKGEKIKYFEGSTEYDEALYVANDIVTRKKNGARYRDFAVLYRTNAQSRVIEETFVKANIPYQMVGGIRFYERKEIKDILAYLRLVANPDDDLSLSRIINVPKRGIGQMTMDKIASYATQNGISLFQAIAEADGIGIQKGIVNALMAFREMISELSEIAQAVPVSRLTEEVLERTGYRLALYNERTIEATTRLENVDEFLSVIHEFENRSDDPSLVAFLAELALVADIDMLDGGVGEEATDSVILMTLHSAKGLEFPHVYLIGMEEGIFPHARSVGEQEALEEERRLAYVGMTRAEELLHLTRVRNRTLFGRVMANPPSRFLQEIPETLIEEVGKKEAQSVGLGLRKPLLRSRRIGGPNVSPSEWRAGDKVEHRKFGRGTVVQVIKKGDDTELDIAFPAPYGVKRLLAELAPITKV